ncbi:MAG: DNA translocase FtsK 4TM domain-containing protein [Candidatus Latescibacteria bacterium]|nr:DNA translocase FtsK 4TM domain-containing protein [Candidatus Latescibacterota bacterium]
MARKTSNNSSSKKSRKQEIIGIVLITVSIFLLVALVTHKPGDWPNSSREFGQPYGNKAGWLGAFVSHWIFTALGLTGYAIVILMLVTGFVAFLHKQFSELVKPAILLIVVGIFLPVLAGLIADIGSGNTMAVPAFRFGGIFCGLLTGFMITYIGKVGAFLLSLTAVLVAVVLTTGIKPSSMVEWVIDLLKPLGAVIVEPMRNREETTSPKLSKSSKSKKEKNFEDNTEEFKSDESPFLTPVGEEAEKEAQLPGIEPTIVDYGQRMKAQKNIASDEEESEISDEDTEEVEDDEYAMNTEGVGDYSEYELPGPDLLDEPIDNAPTESREEMLDKAQRIMESLRHFNIESEVRQITPGPIVTRYELTLAPGIKVGRIVGFSDDLAMALKARGGIRILAPIPGKAAVGIEVPNSTRSVVYLREIVESEPFEEATGPLTFAIGKTTSGDPVVADLEKMPHLLIAGSTGSGKSVCINALIASILMKAPPDMVRMIMIDPKVVELNIYNTIPHLLTPVITDPKRAADSLKWAVREMENRYRQLASLGVRDISQYNAKIASIIEKAVDDGKEIPDPLPLMVIIIDEFSDLMVVASNEIEESIARLAQMSRAVGMHLVIATQRPSADVITGLIKANFPSRIAFKVMQASNSRIILDQGGADKLLGLGDMLFLQAGKPEPVRLHGAYISNEECQRIVDFVASQSEEGPVEVNEEMFQSDDEETDNVLGLRDPNDRDNLFFDAARLVVRHNQGSVSLLQRRLKIGYARAARLIDQLELAGVVSPYDGSKAREVLVDDYYIDELEAGNL